MQPQFSRYYTYIRPITRNRIVRSYATTVFNLVAIAIFAFYAIRPTISTILSLQKGIEEQNQVLTAVTSKRDALAKGRANFDSLDPDIQSKLQNLIPFQPDLPILSAILSNLITQNSATVSGIQFQAVDMDLDNSTPNKDASIITTDFAFSVQGSYDQISTILSEFKKIARLMKIRSVTINRLEGGTVLMVVNATTFYLKN